MHQRPTVAKRFLVAHNKILHYSDNVVYSAQTSNSITPLIIFCKRLVLVFIYFFIELSLILHRKWQKTCRWFRRRRKRRGQCRSQHREAWTWRWTVYHDEGPERSEPGSADRCTWCRLWAVPDRRETRPLNNEHTAKHQQPFTTRVQRVDFQAWTTISEVHKSKKIYEYFLTKWLELAKITAIVTVHIGVPMNLFWNALKAQKKLNSRQNVQSGKEFRTH